MSFSERFLVKPGEKFTLANIDPDAREPHPSPAEMRGATEHNLGRISDLQELLYAEHKRALLICLQAIDAGGKDGVIRHVMGAMNPQGCKVVSFKEPTSAEKDHDFLWRAHRDAPAKGDVTVFNRSHYEEVLIVRVHDLAPKATWLKHYDHINAMEKILSDNGTHIIKFFLHISKDEQLKRFKKRLDDPSKHWKISEADYAEREHWDSYMEAFDDMLTKCSTPHAPWFVIPANHKKFRNFAVSQILVEYLEGLNMKFPKPAVDVAKIEAEYYRAVKD